MQPPTDALCYTQQAKYHGSLFLFNFITRLYTRQPTVAAPQTSYMLAERFNYDKLPSDNRQHSAPCILSFTCDMTAAFSLYQPRLVPCLSPTISCGSSCHHSVRIFMPEQVPRNVSHLVSSLFGITGLSTTPKELCLKTRHRRQIRIHSQLPTHDAKDDGRSQVIGIEWSMA